jgi:RimJ/RimL family protein N-acetyltransferase
MTKPAQPVGPAVDTNPASLPGPVTLTGCFGAVVRLDAARAAAPLWRVFGGHDEIWTYISGHGPFADEKAFTTWLEGRETQRDPYYYTVHDSDGRILGLLALMHIRPAMRLLEIGSIVYSADLQRTPLGTETQYLLARYAFETLGYRRYEWKCDSFNAPSRRAALRYGFVFEGIFRQHMIAKGRSRDTAYFSMLDGEWPERKRNFERWLHGDNFDRNGRQKISLTALNDAKPNDATGFSGSTAGAVIPAMAISTTTMTTSTMSAGEPHPVTGQPIGLPVDPTPAPRPGAVTLKGRYGRLEKLRPDHWADLWDAFGGHDEVWTYISTDGPFSEASEFAAFIGQRAAAEDPYAYAIVDADDRAVGYVTLLRINPQMRVIEVGHVLYSPRLQRTVLGTETQYLLARYVFETLGYRRYEWKCNALNAPSRRAALRYGFIYEGTFRQYMIAKGRNRDDAWFSMLDSEWPARKRNFERWLEPGNFDEKGAQKISLAALNAAAE